jgi:DNA-binding transcriptional MerR regulator
LRELDINQVSKAAGVPASTLRYYDEIGLISAIGRKGLRRVFDERVLETLALIALGRAAGFSLEEIATVFASNGRPQIDRKLLVAKANELDISIRKMSSMRDGLLHAASCSAPSHMECPKFRRLLGIASASGKRDRVKSRRVGKRLKARVER